MKTELVTTLKRKATAVISQVASSHEPLLITQYGLPAVYLVDVDTFEGMERRLAILEGIARGEKAILENRTVSHTQARKKMAAWFS